MNHSNQGRRDVFIPPHLEHDPLNDIPHAGPAAPPAAPAGGDTGRRRKKKKHPARRRSSNRQRRLALFIVILLVFVSWAVLRFCAIPFGTITVQGNVGLTRQDIIEASGVYGYINIIQLSPEDMQYRLNHDLRIASADVKRVFPTTIQVKVEERQVAAVITTMYGYAYVDQNGTVMEIESTPRTDIKVPTLTGKRVDTLLLGDVITDPAIHSSLVYLQKVGEDVAPQIAEINVGNPDNIIVYTVDSLPIHLGTGDNPEERAAITGELLRQVKDNHVNAQYIDTDVRAPFVKTK